MPGYKQNTGKLGEDIAVKYLIKHGYTILERNYRKPWGEIDIIAKKKGILIFFEVKAQKYGFEWRPEENVNWHKKRQLKRIINTYLKESQICGLVSPVRNRARACAPEGPKGRAVSNGVSPKTDWQIDILAIELDFGTKNARVEHIENIILN